MDGVHPNDNPDEDPGVRGMSDAISQGIEARAGLTALIRTLKDRGVLDDADIALIDERGADIANEIINSLRKEAGLPPLNEP